MEVVTTSKAEGRKAAVSSELTIDSPVEKTVDCDSAIVPIEKFFEHYGRHTQLRTIANGGLQDADSEKFIVDASTLFASVYDNLNNAFKDDGTNAKLEEISSKFKDNPEIEKHFSEWCKYRKEMIKITKSAAEDLDQPLLAINVARMISSFVEILNSLNLGIYEKFCFSVGYYADNISPKLGVIVKGALQLAPHLRFMGFASSFYDILRSQIVINRVVNAMKNDKDMFAPLKEWFGETKELDHSVKRLFPYGINDEITLSIEKALEDLGREEKIFTATVLSNLMGDTTIHKNGKFLAEVFLFCKSDTAKEWYRRLITGACSSDIECETFHLRNQLQQLEGAYADSASKLEMGKCTVDQLENATQNNIRTNLGRLVICSMSGMSIFCCYENIRTGSKHRYSDRLRELSTNAQSFLNSMERIRF